MNNIDNNNNNNNNNNINTNNSNHIKILILNMQLAPISNANMGLQTLELNERDMHQKKKQQRATLSRNLLRPEKRFLGLRK